MPKELSVTIGALSFNEKHTATIGGMGKGDESKKGDDVRVELEAYVFGNGLVKITTPPEGVSVNAERLIQAIASVAGVSLVPVPQQRKQ